jgi:hypothetical protein
VQGCAWCGFCAHSVRAHEIQLRKHELLHRFLDGDKFSGQLLEGIIEAEKEFQQ